MEQLVAPWRIDWVSQEDRGRFDECVFCELPEEDTRTDRENYILARGNNAYVLLNNYPYNPGHAMVVPYEHTGDYRDLDEEVLLAKERLVQRTINAFDDSLQPEGYNVGYNLGDGAGGSISEHLHAHIVPRWQGDTNFMPAISDTTVIVEAVLDTYDRLHEAFRVQNGVTAERDSMAVVVEDA